MTFTDHGIGLCSCGVERRLYAPETKPDARWCYPCCRDWSWRISSNRRRVTTGDARAHVRSLIQARRARLLSAGLCIDCGREPLVGGTQRGAVCREKQNARLRKRYA
jgi:hypothetical protein